MNEESTLKVFFKLAPPVMLALLIQSFYNIADSFFVARYSENALTALSLIFPLQLLLTALSNGTSVGINTIVSRFMGMKIEEKIKTAVKTGIIILAVSFVVFALAMAFLIKPFFVLSTDVEETIKYGVQYGNIVFTFSMFVFAESGCTKLLQAKGDMIRPMAAQIIGAVINIVLDPVLIFVFDMGVRGAAISTVLGQASSFIFMIRAVKREFDWSGKFSLKAVKEIYTAAIPQIILQTLYTVYIMGLNLILIDFGEAAVTVLGIYYKLQTFTFIPISGLTQVLVPIVSFNYGAGNKKNMYEILHVAIIFTAVLSFVGTVAFWFFPQQLAGIFSRSQEVLEISKSALKIIGTSFVPCSVIFMIMTFLQASDNGGKSIVLAVLRQVALLVPLAYVFSRFGLVYTWFTFPVTETTVMIAAIILYQIAKKKIEIKFAARS